MKQPLIITLSDRSGSRDIFISAKWRWWLKACCVGCACLILAAGGWLVLLCQSLSENNTQMSALRAENQGYAEREKMLQAALDAAGQVRPVSEPVPAVPVPAKVEAQPVSKLNPKEGSISKKVKGGKVFAPNASRFELVDQRLFLRLVPSGAPLKINWKVSSGFGLRMHPILRRLRLHKGTDFSASPGTAVYATADGVIKKAVTRGSGFGKHVLIQHSLGFTSLYAHLSKITVKPGEQVKKGALVGYSGNSGFSRSPHLHYEVRYLGHALNPINFTKWSVENFQAIFTKESRVPWESLIKHSSQWPQLASLPSLLKAAR